MWPRHASSPVSTPQVIQYLRCLANKRGLYFKPALALLLKPSIVHKDRLCQPLISSRWLKAEKYSGRERKSFKREYISLSLSVVCTIYASWPAGAAKQGGRMFSTSILHCAFNTCHFWASWIQTKPFMIWWMRSEHFACYWAKLKALIYR